VEPSGWCHAPVLVLIDHRDSFTHNLARYFAELGAAPRVLRDTEWTWEQLQALGPERIVLGPGPGPPDRARLALEVWTRAHRLPVLGVCLGHQALGLAHGARIARGPEPVHGRADRIEHSGRGLLRGIAPGFRAARYHSLVVEEPSLPADLVVDARAPDGSVQALRVLDRPHFGLQFHPESILGEWGHRILANFLESGTAPGAS
jgi:anthranilate synthase/aminodeoxychorismate synthase-like glutamine amidotransferase